VQCNWIELYVTHYHYYYLNYLSMKIVNNLFKGYMSALHLYNDGVRDTGIVLVDAGQSAGEDIIEGKNLYLMQDTGDHKLEIFEFDNRRSGTSVLSNRVGSIKMVKYPTLKQSIKNNVYMRDTVCTVRLHTSFLLLGQPTVRVECAILREVMLAVSPH